jgi:peptide/nickel transport system substrate-binding protein
VQFNFEDPVDKIIPDLAEDWQVSPDLLTYTFQIRDGVKWHDGQPFTAQDAKWAVEMLKEKGPRVKSELRTVDRVEAPDASTLRIVLTQPRTSLLSVLGLFTAPIVAKHVFEAAGGDLKQGPNIGTGPFIEGTYKKAVSVEMEPNPDYFEEGIPYLDGLDIAIIRDSATRIASFRVGQVDGLFIGATSVNKVELEQLKRSVPDLQPNPHEKMAAKIVWPNTSVKPWDDVRVRRAAFLAINRWEALEALEDTSTVAGPVVPPTWALSDEELLALPGYRKGADKELDRQEARQLLADAGYPSGFDTESTTPSNVGRLVKLQTFIIDQLGTVGIRVKSNPLPFAEWSVLRKEGTFELIAIEANTAYPDADAATANVFPGVFSTLEDARMVELFNQQSVETDPQKRRELVFDLQRRMLEVQNQIPIAWTGDFFPVHPWVKGGGIVPIGVWARHRLDHVWLTR